MSTIFNFILLAMLAAKAPTTLVNPPAVELKEGKFYESATSKLYTGPYLIIFESTGVTEAKGMLKNGLMDGIWNFYYDNGNLKQTAVYESGRVLRIVNSWYYGGQLASVFNTENEIDTAFYRNCTLKSVTKYSGYTKQGTSVEWYESGSVKKEYVYYDHMANGICRDYYENGRLALLSIYANGQKTGLWEAYFPDGSLKFKGRYSNDFKAGKWFERLENGKLTRTMY